MKRMFSSNEPDESSYIREMESMDDWQRALESQDKPQLI